MERNTDLDWEQFAQADPYWAVLTQDRFHKATLNESARGEFFASGETYIDWVCQTIRTHLDPGFAPRRALDFGCGVGRLVIPLARRCESVVGVDVSESMLAEARRNCQLRGLHHVALVKGDDQLAQVTGKFDLVNSYIVLQHIPPRRGQHLFRTLVALLNQGGVGAIHVTYSNDRWTIPSDFDGTVWPPHARPGDGFWDHWRGLRRAVRRRIAKSLHWPPGKAAAKPQAQTAEPQMQMNAYLLNSLLHWLQKAGVRRIHSELTCHGNSYGVLLFFKNESGAPYAA